MTRATSGPGLVGREAALARLDGARSAVVTGWAGAGRTAVLAEALRRPPLADTFVVRAAPDPESTTVPLSYLSRLRVRPGHGYVHDVLPAALLAASRSADAVLPAVEVIADLLRRAAAERPLTLVLDDLHLADDQSLALVPWLVRRSGAAVLAAARVPGSGRHPRPEVLQALARLDVDVRVHLARLSPAELRAAVKDRLGRAPTSPALERVEARLGTGRGHPGLVLATWPTGTLPRTNLLVRELRTRPAEAALVALAGSREGLQGPAFDEVAPSLRTNGDAVADTVDRLTAAGWLAHDDGRWTAAVPALADALRTDVPPDLRRRLASPSPRLTPPTPRSADGGTYRRPATRSDRVTDQVAGMLRRGYGNARIAATLGLSEKTVEGYVSRLLVTHRCVNRTHLTARLLGAAGDAPPPA